MATGDGLSEALRLLLAEDRRMLETRLWFQWSDPLLAGPATDVTSHP
ncbi:hypothetical protein DFP92_102385 [Yoonia sediminilitoris]|uniref:Uncharacterized protein n=1 Tax=Yoonia sediminilitoris TaxID=1286148 RepID=A0A2T6KMC8_9RHOB|nr:hypothetical protein C8N45_102385 [Yoonia sediminilitoris]RCW97668.1 hypothetical protein DFP92_102385 [Yoonia sediminilitoris]